MGQGAPSSKSAVGRIERPRRLAGSRREDGRVVFGVISRAPRHRAHSGGKSDEIVAPSGESEFGIGISLRYGRRGGSRDRAGMLGARDRPSKSIADLHHTLYERGTATNSRRAISFSIHSPRSGRRNDEETGTRGNSKIRARVLRSGERIDTQSASTIRGYPREPHNFPQPPP